MYTFMLNFQTLDNYKKINICCSEFNHINTIILFYNQLNIPYK